MKKRVDLLLVDKNIVESRTKAKAMIMAGQISINGKKVLKSGETYEEDVNIHVTKLHPQWVSRGALKLCHAIQNFNIEIANLVCLDLGASTGGFTEVLLSKNVKKIINNQEVKILDESYNANPISMKNAVMNFSLLKINKKKVAILGDMLELGKMTKKFQ
mgnify:CR=1 FL=1